MDIRGTTGGTVGKPNRITWEIRRKNNAKRYMHMPSSSARAGFREATGIRRPPFRVRQRAEQSVKVCRIRILRPARSHAANPGQTFCMFRHFSPQFVKIRTVLGKTTLKSSILIEFRTHTTLQEPCFSPKWPNMASHDAWILDFDLMWSSLLAPRRANIVKNPR